VEFALVFLRGCQVFYMGWHDSPSQLYLWK
jgi:hypothetical protein